MAVLAEAWQRFWRNEQLLLFGLALVVGTAAGYGALAFRMATAGIQWAMLGHASERVAYYAAQTPWWQLLAAPALGGLLIGLLIRYVLPGPQPQAVAHVMEAAVVRNGRMSLREGLAAAFVSAASIGCGASVGREGPIVHLGATFGAALARALHLSPALARTLLGCGVAAAIASAFNAPIAGVFFALEVVVGHYGLGAFTPVVISSVIGTVITRLHIGHDAAFSLPPQVVTSFFELPAFILLGLVSAAAAIALMRAIALVQAAHARLGTPRWLRPALAGLATGALAIPFPEVLGVGYEATDTALRLGYALDFLIVLALAKLVATALCLGSGFGGGVFSPSLVLGAMVGSAFGLIAAAVFPNYGSASSVYALLSMGAVAACVLGAPISTVIMIFELTTDHRITFALMITVAVASVVCRQLHWHSFFTWQLEQKGLRQFSLRDQGLLRGIPVERVLRREVVTVGPATPLDELKLQFRERHLPIFVIDEGGRLLGSIEFDDLADAAFDGARSAAITARDLVHRMPATLVAEDHLETALRLCQMNGEEHLPVVSNRDDLAVIGEVRLRDLLITYNEALLQARAAERGES